MRPAPPSIAIPKGTKRKAPLYDGGTVQGRTYGNPIQTLSQLIPLKTMEDFADCKTGRNTRPSPLHHIHHIWQLQMVESPFEGEGSRSDLTEEEFWPARERWLKDYIRSLSGLNNEGGHSSYESNYI